MNFKHFKKVSSDEKKTTLLHPDGHQIIIAHIALKPAHKKDLDALPAHEEQKELPHYADGTNDVGADDNEEQVSHAPPEYYERDEATPYTEAPQDFNASMMGNPRAIPFLMQNQPFNAKPAEETPEQKSAEKQRTSDTEQDVGDTSTVGMGGTLNEPQNPPSPAPMPSIDSNNPYGSMYQNVQQSLQPYQDVVNAQADIASRQGNIQSSQDLAQAQAIKDMMNASGASLSDLVRDTNHVVDEYGKANVNPNLFWDQKTTGQKIMTGLGMAIAGLGGPQNLKPFQDMIHENIEAQKFNIGKFPTLLEANIRKYGSQQLGMQVTMAQNAALYAKLSDALANQVKGPQAQQNAKMLSLLFNQNAAALMQPIAQRVALMQMMQNSQNMSPEYQIAIRGMGGVIPPQQQQQAFEQLQKYRTTMKARDIALSTFDHVNHLIQGGSLSPNDYQAARSRFVESILPLLGGRYSPDRAESIAGAYMPQKLSYNNFGDWKSTAQQKRQGLIQQFDQIGGTDPTMLRGMGINLSNEPFQYDQYGNSKIQTAPPVLPPKKKKK